MKKPDNTREANRRQFNRQADKFSSWSVTKNEAYANSYFHFCRMTHEDRLLDVSCGSGEFCLFCAPNITHAAGFDLSDKMIALAEQQAREAGISNTTFQCADAARLPGESGAFSIVVSKSAFHHYAAHDAIFREMNRCCSSQGRISVQDIVAYDDTYVNDFFESFERLVDASHGAACSKDFILGMYRRHHTEILSAAEITIELNMADYLNHAVRSDEDSADLRQLISKGVKDDTLRHYLYYRENELFFKRNVFLVLGQKGAG